MCGLPPYHVRASLYLLWKGVCKPRTSTSTWKELATQRNTEDDVGGSEGNKGDVGGSEWVSMPFSVNVMFMCLFSPPSALAASGGTAKRWTAWANLQLGWHDTEERAMNVSWDPDCDGWSDILCSVCLICCYCRCSKCYLEAVMTEK